jgi:hypothetical protein
MSFAALAACEGGESEEPEFDHGATNVPIQAEGIEGRQSIVGEPGVHRLEFIRG